MEMKKIKNMKKKEVRNRNIEIKDPLLIKCNEFLGSILLDLDKQTKQLVSQGEQPTGYFVSRYLGKYKYIMKVYMQNVKQE